MKTIILSGGRGYRLKEETDFKPKPMVEVGGRPILWHIMKIYSYYGYSEFVLALGYKSDYIKEFFLNQEYFLNDFVVDIKSGAKEILGKNKEKVIDDFKITFVDTGLETFPGERILRVKKYITEDNFMVTYGDGVSNINIERLVDFHKKQNTLATITGVHLQSSYGLVKVGKNNIVKEFIEKPLLPDFVNGGFMVFKKEALKFFKKDETEHVALKRLADKKQLSLFKHNDFWHCMDTYKDMENLNNLWNTKSSPWKVW